MPSTPHAARASRVCAPGPPGGMVIVDTVREKRGAGEFIQVVSLWARADYSSIERYEFAPPAPR